MPGDLITTGAALVGAGTWFADKVFGSSAEAMGGQLRTYLQSRLPKIFGVAEGKARKLNVELQAIKPGLLARMIVDASFSEDQDDITDWWANLFLDASIAGSNRHAAFSDMMSVIGPVEAQCLKSFMDSFNSTNGQNFYSPATNLSSAVEVMLEGAVAHWLGELPATPDTVFQIRNNMIGGEVPWPLRPISWSFPLEQEPGKVIRSNMQNPWYVENILSVGMLERAGVFEMVKATVPAFGHSSWVKAIAATPLGLEFYGTCTGKLTHGAGA